MTLRISLVQERGNEANLEAKGHFDRLHSHRFFSSNFGGSFLHKDTIYNLNNTAGSKRFEIVSSL